MSSSSRIPLYLFQVLEEEFISLHPLPLERETVKLPDPHQPDSFREVIADFDYLFHPSHIKNPHRFVVELLRQPVKQPSSPNLMVSPGISTHDWTRIELTRAIRTGLDKETQHILRAFNSSSMEVRLNAPTEEVIPTDVLNILAAELNKLLMDPDLYRSERFSSHWFSPVTRNLVTLHREAKFEGEDLTHFNRLILEDAFPDVFARIHEVRLVAMYKRLHRVKQNALCFSGGGIRSGTFSLGVLQGLARHKLLGEFNYLSTVSGGGYIGSWLAAWIHRHPRGLHGVTNDLANSTPDSMIDPDSPPIRHLRRYSNFITPQVGLLSADTWAFIGIYLRNLFLNWVVFIPLLIAALILPRINLAAILSSQAPLKPPEPGSFSIPESLGGRHIFLLLGVLLVAWALAYVIFNRPGVREELRKRRPFWRARSAQRSFLIYCLLPLVSSAFCLTTYWAWTAEQSNPTNPKPTAIIGLFGVGLTLLSWIFATIVLKRHQRDNRKDIDWYEFFAILIAGFIGGCFLGLLSKVSSLGQPIVRLTPDSVFPWLAWPDSPWTWLTWTTELYAVGAVPAFLLTFLFAATIFVGVSSRSTRVDDEDLEWWARLGAWVFIAIISWIVANALVIFGPIALLSAPKTLASIGGLSGLVAILLGRSSKTPANEERGSDKKQSKFGFLGTLVGGSLPLLAMIFIAALLAALSLATTGIFQSLALLHQNSFYSVCPTTISDWFTTLPAGFMTYIAHIFPAIRVPDWFTGAKIVHMNVLHHSSIWFVFVVGLIPFLVGMGLSRVINLNLFSLHAGYRNRLIRAFLGASRPDHERRPNPFTGFDPLDNLSMYELRPGLFDEDDLIDPPRLISMLLDPKRDLSNYLIENDLLQNIHALPNKTTVSPRLVAAVRRDLNGALLDQHLPSYRSPELRPATSAFSARSMAHIMLNRSIIEKAYPRMIRSLPTLEPFKLMPVVNTTLNLVGGDNLAWQQRKAEPFTISPLHSGCFRVGYRDSREYGGNDGGITIGTAAAISGAAASSNMGYYTTSPLISLLLTFFNVRLGWWLGNPGPAGAETYQRKAPKYSVQPVLAEALGFTDDTNEYVYLSDGGHFENLAIYEMVLRRCHVIVVSDGAQDKDYRFTDLGNAIRKIRIDLGVPIDFWNVPIRSGWPHADRGMYWAVGRIRYSCIDGPETKDGLLLYVKPAVYGNEPRDVLEYKKSFPEFPHQTTADQFFDEPQFESYRILGSHIMDQMCGSGSRELDVMDMIERAINRVVESDDTDQRLEKWARTWLRREGRGTDAGAAEQEENEPGTPEDPVVAAPQTPNPTQVANSIAEAPHIPDEQ